MLVHSQEPLLSIKLTNETLKKPSVVRSDIAKIHKKIKFLKGCKAEAIHLLRLILGVS